MPSIAHIAVIILIGFGAILFGPTAKAQNSGVVAVTLDLADVLVVQVEPLVEIILSESDHYVNGNSTFIPNAITISSNKNWDLYIQAEGADFQYLDNKIASDQFTIEVTGNGSGANSGVTALTTSNQLLLDGVSGGMLLSISANYTAIGGIEFFDKPAGGYSNSYTYTIMTD